MPENTLGGSWDISDRDLLFDTISFAPARVGANRDGLRRVGVVDIGSNSVRLVVFDGAARSPAYFYNEKIMCGLGRDLQSTGKLHPDGRERALAAMRRFAILAREMKFSALTTVATAAVREASDGPAFAKQVAKDTGIQMDVASGADEARLAAQGVLLGWPEADGLVSDLGGGSMEMARIKAGEIGAAASTPLGPLRLMMLDEAERKKTLSKHMKALVKAMDGGAERLFLVGGAWRALATVDMARRDYALRVLHEYVMTPQDAAATAELVRKTAPEVLSRDYGASSSRLALLPYASEILLEMVKRVDPKQIAISSYGLREGLLFAHMPKDIRRLDPLLEAARHTEAASARFPGFGDALFGWMGPALPKRIAARARLVKAACLLHDTAWRAHPDYRAQISFENATHANLGGLAHAERVFLGLALANRYKSSAVSAQMPGMALLAESEAQDAAYVGRLMRLGSMVAGGSARALGQTAVRLSGNTLELRVSKGARDLVTEVAKKRLGAAAACLGLDATIA